MRRFELFLTLWIVFDLAGCATSSEMQQTATAAQAAQDTHGRAQGNESVWAGPQFQVSHSLMAEILRMIEGISIWRRDINKNQFRFFDDKFGLDESDRALLRRFALVRYALWEKEQKQRPKMTFDKPFGPEGLFPSKRLSLQSQMALRFLDVDRLSDLEGSLQTVLEPKDASVMAQAAQRISSRVIQLVEEHQGFQKQLIQIKQLLFSPALGTLLSSLGRFAQVDARQLTYSVHPVWQAADRSRVALHQNTLIVPLVDGKVGPNIIAEIVVAVFENMLSRLPSETKVLLTNRFVEKAGFRAHPFVLIQALKDAAGYGLAWPLVAHKPNQKPTWPGDETRQRTAMVFTSVLKNWLGQQKAIDGVFAIEAANAYLSANSAKPSDYIDGSMVIAHEAVLKPFREKVTRWAVWKYPLSGKYNYLRKLNNYPGRSVLMVLTPKDLTELPQRFGAHQPLQGAFGKVAATLETNRGAILCLPRQSRGYIFLIAATGPKAMGDVSKRFFELDNLPNQVVAIP